MYVIGIDPGPLPGIVRLILAHDNGPTLISADALQVTPGALFTVIQALSEGLSPAIALERFVVGRRAAQSAAAVAGARTRDMIGEITGWAGEKRLALHSRSASEVKPWAIDKRLEAAGLLDLTTGMRHARDAARHALYCAVRDYGLPDPLSNSARRR